MIHEVSGDILLTGAQAIAHGVAPNDHFDSGLALALRENWPALARDFRHYAHQAHPRAGELWTWGGTGGVRIYNLLTQDGEIGHGTRPGRATISTVNHCLRRLRHELDKGEVASLAIPKIATGIGGLAWQDVFPVIKEHLADLKLPVFVYTTFHKGQTANEPGR